MNWVGSEYNLVNIVIAKKNTDLREKRKLWFAPMEQKLQEMHTKEDDSLFYYHSSEDRIVLSHAMFWTMTQLQFFKSKMRKVGTLVFSNEWKVFCS